MALIFFRTLLRSKLRITLYQNFRLRQNSADKFLNAICFKISEKLNSSPLPMPMYGGRYLVTMLPGTGIGPEMCGYIREVFSAANAPVDFEVIESSSTKEPQKMEQLIEEAVASIKRNRLAVKGNLRDEVPKVSDPNVSVRTQLDLYVYYVHYLSHPDVKARFPNVNMVMVRQNTQGEYMELEHQSVPGYVESLKITTARNVRRVAKWAFEFAKHNKRKKITCVHKAQHLKLSDGLFLAIVTEIAKDYPQITFEDQRVDRICTQLVVDPSIFDVLLMPNLYGNIISNVVAGLLGGAGLHAAINCGEEAMIFESAVRHKGDRFKGKNIANPIAMLKASVNVLKHLGKTEHANIIMDGIVQTLTVDKVRTPDLGGTNTSRDIVSNVLNYIANNTDKYKLF